MIISSDLTKTRSISSRHSRKVAIIGGGFSGLYSLKHALSQGLDATLYESSDDIGGVWNYRENIPGGVWRNAYATSSKTFMHPSDFPLPDDIPIFPHHTHILNHLRHYTQHFNLWSHIKLNHKVIALSKNKDKWDLTAITKTNIEITTTFDAVIICVGQNSKPAYPQEEMYSNFTGKIIHCYDYKFPTEEMNNKSILIVGGGESASDIANEVSMKAACVYMSIRNGQWFLEKHTGGKLAFDTRFSRKSRILATNYGNNPIVKLYELMYATSNGEGGHGINEWRPTVPLMNEFINKSRTVLDKVVKGKVIPQRGVQKIQGNLVWFEGVQEPKPIDLIIFATGFKSDFSFLKFNRHYLPYKYVFEPNDPTLAYVGNIRPVFGSITALAELQARWVTAFFAGNCRLPSAECMKKEIDQDMVKHKRLFPSKHERLPQLVSHFEYADYIVRQLGKRPNFLKLFFTDNKKWRVLLNAPWTPFETIINEPKNGKTAYENLLKEYTFRRAIIGPSLFKLMIYIIMTTILSGLFLFHLIFSLLGSLLQKATR